jgi:type II secretory pathway component GspD/PulD (secretin)
MEFKGTKGKWEISSNDIKANQQTIFSAYGFFVKGKYTHTEETKANALLISKAPEMLEMLKEVVTTYDNERLKQSITMARVIDRAEQLIKEATEL